MYVESLATGCRISKQYAYLGGNDMAMIVQEDIIQVRHMSNSSGT